MGDTKATDKKATDAKATNAKTTGAKAAGAEASGASATTKAAAAKAVGAAADAIKTEVAAAPEPGTELPGDGSLDRTPTQTQIVTPDAFPNATEKKLEMGELIDNQSPEFAEKKAGKMAYLLGKVQDADQRIEKWRRSQNGTKVSHRRAFNDRNTGLRPGVRKLTVRW